jgi:NAD(P)-dependent dehydrogenase (short-subunit alcohol dehydrogenase family)
MRETPGLAIVVGVGPGFGYALARMLALEGFDTVLVSRDAGRLSPLVNELRNEGAAVSTYGADATDELAVSSLFERIQAAHGTPSLVVYSIQDFSPGAASEIEVPSFETAWRHNCLGAFLTARESARRMIERKCGTIVFVGSTSSLIGRAGHLNLAVGKFGQRALAQVMARELWPRGIHVAHAVIDADIAENSLEALNCQQSDPSHIASSILALHRQPKTAWTSELDLRPWNEQFWEHC